MPRMTDRCHGDLLRRDEARNEYFWCGGCSDEVEGVGYVSDEIENGMPVTRMRVVCPWCGSQLAPAQEEAADA